MIYSAVSHITIQAALLGLVFALLWWLMGRFHWPKEVVRLTRMLLSTLGILFILNLLFYVFASNGWFINPLWK